MGNTTVTARDIHDHVVAPACGPSFDTATRERITTAIIAAAPLSTWRLVGLEYESDQLDTDTFWAIVERTADTGTSQ